LAEFNNPQQEPGMERKLLMVFALTFLVIMLFQPLMKKYGPQPPAQQASPQTAQTQNQAQPSSQNPAQVPAQISAEHGNAGKAAVRETGQAPSLQAASESETVIENDVYRIVFTNRGARVKSWVLKKYTDDKGGQLELVNGAAAEKYGYPLTLWSYDEGLRNQVNSALYVASSQFSVPSSQKTGSASALASSPQEIKFVYSDGDVRVEKSFTFDQDSYVVGVKTAVYRKGAQITAFPMWPAGVGDQITAPQYAASQMAYQYDGKIERLSTASWTVFPSIKVVGGNTLPGPFHWAGVSDQYFAAEFVPADPQNAALVTLRNPIEIRHSANDANDVRMDKVDVLGAAVGSLKGPSDLRIYVGPKSLAELQSVSVPGITGADPDLRKVIDFGSMLGYIAVPLFLWLKWMHGHIVANWGWAILLQTLVINLALLPLRLSQMKSMLRMQRVAPQIKQIQEKYKKYSLRDPEKAKMNEEVAALYKKEGVNPLGGCLPMLIQMPFLFAYYRMLNVAMDLRHAPWLWIKDLSAPDPRYILPVSIVVTMFLLQRMTPQGGMDPAQQKMMNLMMPVMMGFISFNLPAGLGLYWCAGQVIMIAQQAALNRSSLGREMREMMAKRARKKEK
jgi:YidC/Oxa1 family membrane protein insertase